MDDDGRGSGIEKRMKENSAVSDAWVKRRLQMELIERDLPEPEDMRMPRCSEAQSRFRV